MSDVPSLSATSVELKGCVAKPRHRLERRVAAMWQKTDHCPSCLSGPCTICKGEQHNGVVIRGLNALKNCDEESGTYFLNCDKGHLAHLSCAKTWAGKIPDNLEELPCPACEICAICQETCEANEWVHLPLDGEEETLVGDSGDGVLVGCGHLFCEPCLATAVKEKNACPTCRAEIGTLPDASSDSDAIVAAFQWLGAVDRRMRELENRHRREKLRRGAFVGMLVGLAMGAIAYQQISGVSVVGVGKEVPQIMKLTEVERAAFYLRWRIASRIGAFIGLNAVVTTLTLWDGGGDRGRSLKHLAAVNAGLGLLYVYAVGGIAAFSWMGDRLYGANWLSTAVTKLPWHCLPYTFLSFSLVGSGVIVYDRSMEAIGE